MYIIVDDKDKLESSKKHQENLHEALMEKWGFKTKSSEKSEPAPADTKKK